MYNVNSNIVSFVLINDETTSKALEAAKIAVGGESNWKSGYSPEKSETALTAYTLAGGVIRRKITGTLDGISIKENTDGQGNTYRKVRVELGIGKGKSEILSLDVGSEYTERLLPKLGTAVRNHFGAEISLSVFVVEEQRGERKFFNLTPGLKDEHNSEIQATINHFKVAAERSAAAVAALKSAGIKDPKALKAAQKSAKEEYFWELAQKIAAFSDRACQGDT